MAASLEPVEENTHTLIDILHLSAAGKVALPVNNAIIQPAETICQTSFSISLVAK